MGRTGYGQSLPRTSWNARWRGRCSRMLGRDLTTIRDNNCRGQSEIQRLGDRVKY